MPLLVSKHANLQNNLSNVHDLTVSLIVMWSA